MIIDLIKIYCKGTLRKTKKLLGLELKSPFLKYKEILLITGKGLHSSTSTNTYVSEDLSKLKYSVPEYIKNNDEINRYVVSISEASPKDGGSGAILIKLKNL